MNTSSISAAIVGLAIAGAIGITFVMHSGAPILMDKIADNPSSEPSGPAGSNQWPSGGMKTPDYKPCGSEPCGSITICNGWTGKTAYLTFHPEMGDVCVSHPAQVQGQVQDMVDSGSFGGTVNFDWDHKRHKIVPPSDCGYDGMRPCDPAKDKGVSAEKCLGVSMEKIDQDHYRMESVNKCDREMANVYVLVKFLDSDGARVGAGNWEAHYVAKGERLRRVLAAPVGVVGWSKVEVRKISEDAGDSGK